MINIFDIENKIFNFLIGFLLIVIGFITIKIFIRDCKDNLSNILNSRMSSSTTGLLGGILVFLLGLSFIIKII